MDKPIADLGTEDLVAEYAALYVRREAEWATAHGDGSVSPDTARARRESVAAELDRRGVPRESWDPEAPPTPITSPELRTFVEGIRGVVRAGLSQTAGDRLLWAIDAYLAAILAGARPERPPYESTLRILRTPAMVAIVDALQGAAPGKEYPIAARTPSGEQDYVQRHLLAVAKRVVAHFGA